MSSQVIEIKKREEPSFKDQVMALLPVMATAKWASWRD